MEKIISEFTPEEIFNISSPDTIGVHKSKFPLVHVLVAAGVSIALGFIAGLTIQKRKNKLKTQTNEKIEGNHTEAVS